MWKCFKIYFVEMVAVMFVATIGIFVRAVYPKRDGYGFMRPILSIVSEKYFDYLLPLLFGVTSVILIGCRIDADISMLVLFFATLLVFIPSKHLIVFSLSWLVPKRIERLFTERGWDLSKHAKDVEKSLDFSNYILSIVGFGIYFLSVYFLVISLNIALDFSQVVLIMSVTSLITLLPISFFGVGTRDAGLVVTFKWFGYSSEEAIALSLALLLLRVAIICMGAMFWFMDPPPLLELKKGK